MDVSLLPATTEQLPTADAKSLENGQAEPVEGVALPVFSALLALTQAADPTVEADAEALAIRQALAGEGKNLPPATLVRGVRPLSLPLTLDEGTQAEVQALAKGAQARSPVHAEGENTPAFTVRPGPVQASEIGAPQAERLAGQYVEPTPPGQRNAPSVESTRMASTTELAVGEAQQANLSSTTRAPSDSLASSVAPPNSSVVGTDQALLSGTRPTTLALPNRLGTPEWGEAFASRVAWAANSNVQVAELRLNPPQLGHIGVHIAIHNNKADIAFATPHAEVLATIESALPRLRELFGEGGVALGYVDVSQHGSGGAPGRERDMHPHAKFFAVHETASETDKPLTIVSKGLVDHYV